MRGISKGYILVLTAVVFWASQGTLGKLFMDAGVHPVTLAATRILIGSFMFLLYILVTDPKSLHVNKADYLYFLYFGVCTIGILHFSLNYAIFYTGVATSSILLYTAPAFVTLLSIFFFGEKPTWQRILALTLTLLGCFFIIRSSQELNFNPLGVLLGILSGFSYGMWSILGKKGLAKYSAAVLNFYNLFLGGLALLFAALFIAGPESFKLSTLTWGSITLMTLVNTFIPAALYVSSMRYMAASKTSILANIEVVVAVILSYIIFREAFTFFKILGFITIGAGLLLIMSEDYKRKDAL